ncbi:MAG TPA: hypothetical protein VMU14_16215, partial [Acidimicrobiales bacterium]|nr:hypothetical protein [Acidimicrobiales bacterium]
VEDVAPCVDGVLVDALGLAPVVGAPPVDGVVPGDIPVVGAPVCVPGDDVLLTGALAPCGDEPLVPVAPCPLVPVPPCGLACGDGGPDAVLGVDGIAPGDAPGDT